MITWATTEFTQIRWKRHVDVKLLGWSVLSAYIFHTLKYVLPIDQTTATSFQQNRVDLFRAITALKKH